MITITSSEYEGFEAQTITEDVFKEYSIIYIFFKDVCYKTTNDEGEKRYSVVNGSGAFAYDNGLSSNVLATLIGAYDSNTS
jgi:hypothetical protein